MEFCLYTSIPDTVNLQLKDQTCTLYSHVQREVQVIKFNALGCSQACKKALRHGVQVRRERAYVDKSFAKRVRCNIHVAGNEVIFDDQRLTWPEVACVVE
jgi:hypothetical protein